MILAIEEKYIDRIHGTNDYKQKDLFTEQVGLHLDKDIFISFSNISGFNCIVFNPALKKYFFCCTLFI